MHICSYRLTIEHGDAECLVQLFNGFPPVGIFLSKLANYFS